MYTYKNIVYHREPVWLKTDLDVNDYVLPSQEDPNEYIDYRCQDIKYNHMYYSEHPESYGAIYFVTRVIRDNNQTKIKIQFVPGLHEVMISFKAFQSNMIYDPYFCGLFYGHCCIGNMSKDDLDKYKDEFDFWKAYMGRLFDPQHPYYPAFGANGYLPSELNFICFEWFHNYNKLLLKNGKIPMVDINDQGLYIHPNCIFTRAHRSITLDDARDMSKLPTDGHRNIALPMRIREMPLWNRDQTLLKKAGRPKKDKQENNKVCMYHLI